VQLDPSKELAHRILCTLLGAKEISRAHFLRKWGNQSYFAIALDDTPYTFRVEPDRWYVTSALSIVGDTLHIANEALERCRLGVAAPQSLQVA
jgi:hypothetical protein